MFKNKTKNGISNLCGQNVALLIKEKNLSQRALADKLQLAGMDLTKNAIQRIESGQRFVSDIELKAFADLFKVSLDKLIA